MPAEGSTYTYFILDPLSGDIKIGISGNPRRRLKDMQTGVSRELILIGSINGNHESSLHGMFNSLRLKGEWFAPGPELIDYIILQSGLRIRAPLKALLLSLRPIADRTHRALRHHKMQNAEDAWEAHCDSLPPEDEMCSEFWVRSARGEPWQPGNHALLEDALADYRPDEADWCKNPVVISQTIEESLREGFDYTPAEYDDSPFETDCECPICCWERAMYLLDFNDIVTRVGVNEGDGTIVAMVRTINNMKKRAQLDGLYAAASDLDFIFWDLIGMGKFAPGYSKVPGDFCLRIQEIGIENTLIHRRALIPTQGLLGEDKGGIRPLSWQNS